MVKKTKNKKKKKKNQTAAAAGAPPPAAGAATGFSPFLAAKTLAAAATVAAAETPMQTSAATFTLPSPLRTAMAARAHTSVAGQAMSGLRRATNTPSTVMSAQRATPIQTTDAASRETPWAAGTTSAATHDAALSHAALSELGTLNAANDSAASGERAGKGPEALPARSRRATAQAIDTKAATMKTSPK